MEINHQDLAYIVEALQSGDMGQFQDLYNLSYNHLYTLSLQILKNEHDAQDATHEAYHKIYTQIDQLDHPMQFLAWARRIATNASLGILRKQYDIPTQDIPEYIAQSLPPVQDNLEIILDLERQDSLMDLIEKLDSQTRDIMMLKYYQGYKVKEIEEILGIKTATIKTRIHRTKKLLRQQIKEQQNKTFALPVALIPAGYILKECTSKDASSVIKGPQVLKYTWSQSSAVAKATVIASATTVAVGGLAVGNHQADKDNSVRTFNQTSDTDLIDINTPVVEILDYEDGVVRIGIIAGAMSIDYNSIYGEVNGAMVLPTSIDKDLSVVCFAVDTDTMILNVGNNDGNVTSYALTMHYE